MCTVGSPVSGGISMLFENPPGSYTWEEHDTRRQLVVMHYSDGSLPEHGPYARPLGVSTTLDVIEYAPEGPTAPLDKWGREIRVGDLLFDAHRKQPYRVLEVGTGICGVALSDLKTRFVSSSMTTDEILSRGSLNDPVPEKFEPERDAEGRPVLDGPERRDVFADFMRQADRNMAEERKRIEEWTEAVNAHFAKHMIPYRMGKLTADETQAALAIESAARHLAKPTLMEFTAVVKATLAELAPAVKVWTDRVPSNIGTGWGLVRHDEMFVAWIEFPHFTREFTWSVDGSLAEVPEEIQRIADHEKRELGDAALQRKR